MTDQPALSPSRSKELRNRHPLYRRLSGESVWLFLEELGLDETQCEAFMDAFFRQMEAVLLDMDKLERQPDLVGTVSGLPLPGCTCGGRHGCRLAWPTSGPGVPLPPYAVGCPLRVRVHSREDAPALPDECVSADAPWTSAAAPPEMLCPVLAASPRAALPRYLAQFAAGNGEEKI